MAKAVVVWIKLEIEGDDARAHALEVVGDLLDGGTPQDEFNDAGYEMKVTSATVHPE
jgi:hypothetical protein